MPAAAIALATLAPAAYLVLREGFNLSLLRHELATPGIRPLVENTLTLLGAVCLVTGTLGTGLAVLLTRTRLPWRRFWMVLFTMPLGIPSFVGSYAWVAFSYRYFPGSKAIFGLGGATAIISLSLFPYVFLPVLAALRRLDPGQEEVARSLGHSPLSVFLRTTLPQLQHAIATGLLIISLHVLAEFGAVEMLNYQTITTGIVQRVTILGEPESARALAFVLTLGSILILALNLFFTRNRQPLAVGSGTPRPPVLWRLGWHTTLWLLLCVSIAGAALAVPLWATVSGMLSSLGSEAGGIDWQALGTAAANTVTWAAWAAALATLCALPISLLAVRRPGALTSFFERSTWVAHSLPGVVMALSLVYITSQWFYPLYQSAFLLVIGYVIMYLPLAVGSQQVGIAQASRGLDDVSRSLGKGAPVTFLRVTLPLSLPAILVGALLVGLDAGKELTTTLLLHPTGQHTLATRLWVTTEGELLDFAAAAPYGLALLIIGAIPALLLSRSAISR